MSVRMALGTAAPLGSVTEPLKDVVACAFSSTANSTLMITERVIRLYMAFPFALAASTISILGICTIWRRTVNRNLKAVRSLTRKVRL
jgi:hypothetical protein